MNYSVEIAKVTKMNLLMTSFYDELLYGLMNIEMEVIFGS